MPGHRSKSEKRNASQLAQSYRRDPYEVLGVSKRATDQEIKSAYRKLALKYHSDKNANDPEAAEMFKEATFSYNILADQDKRRNYDSAGFEAVELESQELVLDLSNLNAVNTVLAALFSKLGVPIKTTVSTTLLEEALNGKINISPLVLGVPVSRKVDKQCAHFYSVTLKEDEAREGLVCRVNSSDKSKFKLLYFDREDNGGLSLCLQETSSKTGKVTSAGMYFLGFPVYHFEQTPNTITTSKNADAAFFRKLDAFQPCELTELKAGTHYFAVYGTFFEEKAYLREVESQILSKRVEISKFESEYGEVLAQFTEMTSRYADEMQEIDQLLKQWNDVRASYTAAPVMKRTTSKSKIKMPFADNSRSEKVRDRKPSRDKKRKMKWFNIHSKVDKSKTT